MATWEDGPEYAPLERPELFEQPDVEPLPVGEPFRSLAEGAPAVAPEAYQPPSQPVAPLASLAPAAGPTRDPHEAFDVATAAVTAATSEAEHPYGTGTSSAWSATHSSGIWAAPTTPPPSQFDPSRPIALADRSELWETSSTGRPGGSILTAPPRVQMASPWGAGPVYGNQNVPQPAAAGLPAGYGVPGTPSWFGPGAGPVPTKGTPITLAELVRAMTPGLAIVLGVAIVVFPLSPVLYLVAFGLSNFVRYRAGFVKTVFGVGALIQVFIAFIVLTLDTTDLSSWWNSTAITGSIFSLLTLIVIGITMALALRNGEKPSRAA